MGNDWTWVGGLDRAILMGLDLRSAAIIELQILLDPSPEPDEV